MNVTSKPIETWCGSLTEPENFRAVIAGWKRHSKKLRRQNERLSAQKSSKTTLEYELTLVLSKHCGERAESHRHGGEGAVETLERIIFERDRALEILALDRLRNS